MNLPPALMWDLTQDTWTTKSLLLLEAFEMYEGSLCGGCGQSAFHALDVANTRAFAVDTGTCLGCNVRETWSANNPDDKTKGLKVYVTNAMGLNDDDDDE